jgi:3-hydroxyacyl-[acyl-carrier-protein] dehydratase
MSAVDITCVLAHREPILLVDQVIELIDGRSLVARRTIATAQPGHYVGLAGNPAGERCAYPAALVLESWCQAAGILGAWRETSCAAARGPVLLLSGLRNVRSCGRAWPGDVMEHRVRLLKALDDNAVFEGESFGGDGRCLQTIERVVMAMRPAASLARSPRDRTGGVE